MLRYVLCLSTLVFGCFEPLSGESTPEAGEMVEVPAGAFDMGCNETIDANCNEDEYPLHEVVVSAYQIDVTEVTRAKYLDCVGAGDCTAPWDEPDVELGPDIPVVYVEWSQARDYCQFVGKRLPTEAEWEKAARGTDIRVYPWGNELPSCDRTNIEGCGDAIVGVDAHPAGRGPYGTLGMGGNVHEWVSDWYDSGYYEGSPREDPRGPAGGESRGIRGASYSHGPADARVSFRDWAYPEDAIDDVGFRCAR